MKDVIGDPIRVGDLVAYAMHAGHSAGVLVVGYVEKLPVGNSKMKLRDLKPSPYNGKAVERYVNARSNGIVRLHRDDS